MVARIVQEPGDSGTMYTGSATVYARDEEDVGRGTSGEQGLESVRDQQGQDLSATKERPGRTPKVLRRLIDLPRTSWKRTRNESRGCQYYTRAKFGPLVKNIM